MPRTFRSIPEASIRILPPALEEQINERERGNNIPIVQEAMEPITINQTIEIDADALRRAVEDFRAGINTTFSTNIELYQKITGGNWFFKDKEGKECGPFDTKKQAEREYKKY